MPLRPMKPCAAPQCRALVRGARYCEAHKHLAEAWATSKRSDKSGLTGRAWRRLRDQIMKRDGYICRCDECRRTGTLKDAHEVDHIVPLSQGGTDAAGNLRAINRDCHRAKTHKEAQTARQRATAAGEGGGREK
jgi:5-methylcytosine-specific restriction protein A